MKKFVLPFAAVAALSLPAAGHAQQSAAGTVNASATVLANLVVTNIANLNFGSIPAGSGATVIPGGTPASGQSMGVLKIDHNSAVSVVATLPAALKLAGAPDLPVTFECGYSLNASGALDGVAGACNILPQRVGNGDGSSKSSYIQIGGAILAENTAARIPGTYSADLTFTVTAIY